MSLCHTSLALDQGTTSSRAILFDHDGAVRSVAQRELEQIFPHAGWVEHNPEEIWTSQISVAVQALGRVELRPRDIVAIGIANQRENHNRLGPGSRQADLQRHCLAGSPHGRILRPT